MDEAREKTLQNPRAPAAGAADMQSSEVKHVPRPRCTFLRRQSYSMAVAGPDDFDDMIYERVILTAFTVGCTSDLRGGSTAVRCPIWTIPLRNNMNSVGTVPRQQTPSHVAHLDHDLLPPTSVSNSASRRALLPSVHALRSASGALTA